jgi:tetratricopeptide (TPR) repeat protein
LELFIPVCQAIQHAHQKGIIHRDIKPSNVLVAQFDGKPVPKVIDFGVAKATGQQLTDQTLVTGFGAIVGTLEYMSPEQAELNQLDIDTRSDIYALGVLLYELLTGTTPLEKKLLRRVAFDEMLRIIREHEPPKPSTRLSDSKESLPSISAQRQMEPAKLTKLVRGELDWIVMKALEKDRNRRYETANGLARDIEHYLSDEPVEACPPSATYRLSKFVRRNQGPMLAASLVLLALIGGIVGTTWGLLQAERNAKQARDERDAKDLALKAEQQARADEAKARHQAFAALRSMTADVVERKFAQGTVLTEDDRAFLRGVIAQYDAFAAIKGDDAESRSMRAEGRFRVGTIRLRLGGLKEAENDYSEALNIYRQLAVDFPTESEFRQKLAKSYGNRGVVRRAAGRLPEAEQDNNEAVTLDKQLVVDFPSRPEFRQELAKSLNNRGILLRAAARLSEAEKDWNDAVAIYEQLAADFRSRPEFREELASLHRNRGVLLKTAGRFEDAEKDYDQAVLSYQQLVVEFSSRPEFRQMLAKTYDARGTLLDKVGRHEEEKQDYDRALEIRKQLAAEYPSRPEYREDLASSHNNRGALLYIAGRYEEAEKEYVQALAIQRQLAADFPNQPDVHSGLGGTSTNLAAIYQQHGDWAGAKRLLLEGVPHHLAALTTSPRHPNYRADYRNHLKLLIAVHAGMLEPQTAVRTAETCRDLGWNPPADAYDAAGFLSRCIPVVAKHDKLDEQQRKEAAQFYGDAAMKLLREAVSKGYKDAAHMKKDTHLDPLRERENFKKLVAELEGKGK